MQRRTLADDEIHSNESIIHPTSVPRLGNQLEASIEFFGVRTNERTNDPTKRDEEQKNRVMLFNACALVALISVKPKKTHSPQRTIHRLLITR
jgi:hypothetical protein